jgi:hypothetical protein
MMNKRKLGKRELMRSAFANAAAMVRDADFGSLYGDDLADIIGESEENENKAHEAQHAVAAYLQKRAKP